MPVTGEVAREVAAHDRKAGDADLGSGGRVHQCSLLRTTPDGTSTPATKTTNGNSLLPRTPARNHPLTPCRWPDVICNRGPLLKGEQTHGSHDDALGCGPRGG